VLRIGSVLLFPPLAVWAWREGGRGRLWRLTGLAALLVLLVAVLVATPAGGNALVRSHGYGYTVTWSLIVHGLTVVLPMVAASLAVLGLAGRWPSGLVLYPASLLAAGVAWLAGVLAAAWLLHLVLR
jgi:hypothetical protein